MVEELLGVRGIYLTYETVRRWPVKFGLGIGCMPNFEQSNKAPRGGIVGDGEVVNKAGLPPATAVAQRAIAAFVR